ncbi:YncE family protein [Flammeovirga kamogawensis]|uniref:YncE family protein n=1 Tax=Flammeovirga kamogawensis TaxID=373891 RepID=A0ABX8GWL4_9BACT|nr:DUF5074 domain-containing protein [Flammeovirga kamogawensis]MBB6461152.1 YVTN family beta-propeller protein [Flammeovirga kamogawensis]QWG07718.1 hypothetical protein KM029_01910 [Flammeovirga kamogawensis]TRX69525.1 hypothetical protein EO216_15845 [Flammeovirga kamogawensis]
MKNFYKLSSLLLVLIGLSFASCEKNEEQPYIPGTAGFYVNNSGNFSEGNGSITGVVQNGEEFTLSQRVFNSANGAGLGGITEGFYSDGIIGIISVQAADKIEIVDIKTMVRRFDPISEGILTPRYTAKEGNFAYTTVWGPYEDDYSLKNSKVVVINTSTGKQVAEFNVGGGPEGIVIYNGKIYVAISNSTNVEVYNMSSYALEATIDVMAAPQHFVIDRENNLWVSTSAGYLFPAPATTELGVAKLNTTDNTVASKVQYSGIGKEGDIQISEDGYSIYVLGSDDVYQNATTEVVSFGINDTSVDSPVISGKYFKGIGVNPANGNIHVAVAESFSESGSFRIYSKDGDMLSEQATGVGPFHFVFY